MTKRSQKCAIQPRQPTITTIGRRALNVRSTRRDKKQPRRRPLKTRTRRRQQTSVVSTKEHGTSHRLGGTDDAIAKAINENFKVYRVYLVDSTLVTEAPSNLLDRVNNKIYIFVSEKTEGTDSSMYVCQSSLNGKTQLKIGTKDIPNVSLVLEDLQKPNELNINESDLDEKISFVERNEDDGNAETPTDSDLTLAKILNSKKDSKKDSDNMRKSSIGERRNAIQHDAEKEELYQKTIDDCVQAFDFSESIEQFENSHIFTFDLASIAPSKQNIHFPVLFLDNIDSERLSSLFNNAGCEFVIQRDYDEDIAYQFAKNVNHIRLLMDLGSKSRINGLLGLAKSEGNEAMTKEIAGAIESLLPFGTGLIMKGARMAVREQRAAWKIKQETELKENLDYYLSGNMDSREYKVINIGYENQTVMAMVDHICHDFQDFISSELLEIKETTEESQTHISTEEFETQVQLLANDLDLNDDEDIQLSEIYSQIQYVSMTDKEHAKLAAILEILFPEDKKKIEKKSFVETCLTHKEDSQILLTILTRANTNPRVCEVESGPITLCRYKSGAQGLSTIIVGVIHLSRAKEYGFEEDQLKLVVLLQVGLPIYRKGDISIDNTKGCIVTGTIATMGSFTYSKASPIINKLKDQVKPNDKKSVMRIPKHLPKSIQARLRKEVIPYISEAMCSWILNTDKINAHWLQSEVRRLSIEVQRLKLRVRNIPK